jgi:hypothetical protein
MRIPIKAAKELSNRFGLNAVVIWAWRVGPSMKPVSYVVTYGKNKGECRMAAEWGNDLKKQLGWPENLCEAKPSRLVRREQQLEQGIRDFLLMYGKPGHEETEVESLRKLVGEPKAQAQLEGKGMSEPKERPICSNCGVDNHMILSPDGYYCLLCGWEAL